MAILSGVAGVLGRFAGRLLNSSLGWATILLFGKVSGRKQTVLLLVALASVLWLVLIAGVILPDLGTALIAFVPAPSFVSRDLIRLVMLVAAVALPLAVGIAAIFLGPASGRPSGSHWVTSLLRGYPFTLLLALTILLLAGVGIVRKVQSLTKRWEDAHVAVIVKPGGYDEVLAQIEGVLNDGNLPVERRAAPRILSAPPRLLAAVAGEGLRSLVPERLALLKAEDMEALVYPSDISIAGTKEKVAVTRALIASQLTHAPAYLTTAAEAQEIEDDLRELLADRPSASSGRDDRLQEVDRKLMRLTIPFDEWDTLYRERLQVEHALARDPAARGAAVRGDREQSLAS